MGLGNNHIVADDGSGCALGVDEQCITRVVDGHREGLVHLLVDIACHFDGDGLAGYARCKYNSSAWQDITGKIRRICRIRARSGNHEADGLLAGSRFIKAHFKGQFNTVCIAFHCR